MVKVSIIVPIYNVEKYLSRCLESIINQTLPEIEIICINDGSKDNSLAILEEYALKDNRIKVINMPQNKGQSVARNKGLEIAKGEYIMFVDSDDYIHPQSADILYNIAKKENVDIVSTTKVNNIGETKHSDIETYNIEDLKYKEHNSPIDNILKTKLSQSIIWDKIYKRELIKNKPFIEGIYFEDWCWIICLFSSLKKYLSLDIALYNYNTTNTSTMRSSFSSKKINDFVIGIKNVFQHYQKQENIHLWRKVQKQRISKTIKLMINKTYKEYKNTSSKELLKTLIKELTFLHHDKIFFYHDIPLHPLIRYLELKMIYKRNR
ncbi:MAG: glycosyltransferase family 2 protein [Alphaproteobacteria bacterium]|nr:glycosyltransferase family 2 protein [Alphaproteobacteria bacterium]